MGRGSRGGGPVEGVARRTDTGLAELVPDRDRPRAWTLLLDGAPQSHVDLDDPTHLAFEYQRRLGHIADLTAPPGRPVTALHLGGGALTLARYIAATRPRSRQQAAETDTALTGLVRELLPLDRTWQLRVRGSDARALLERAPEGAADLVIADVFSGARVPAHCATVEFAALARRALHADGHYAVNITDGAPLAFARAQVATLLQTFPEVCLIGDPAVLRGRRFGNLVLLAGRSLPVADLTRRVAADPFPGRVEHGRPVTDFTGGAAPLTDATAIPSPTPPPGTFDTPR